jgi:hypothetical protein
MNTPDDTAPDSRELERRQIPVERRIAALEARRASAREVFEQAARELAAMQGIRGWLSGITGRRQTQVAESERAAKEARTILEKTTADLEAARAELAELRRTAAETLRREQEDIEAVLRAQRIAEGAIHDVEEQVASLDESERADALRTGVMTLGRTAAADLDAVLESTRDKAGLLAGGPAALEMLRDVGEYAIEAGWVDDPEALRSMLRHIDVRIAPLVDPAVPPGRGDKVVVAELRGLLEVCDDRLHAIAPAATVERVQPSDDEPSED